jgi:NitT/TauT family transport system substrate-binding protein
MGASRVQQALLAGAVDAASTLEPILTVVQQRDPSALVVAAKCCLISLALCSP